jgi:hypothetical protein
MPIFEIQGADGKIYEVDAPDQASAVQAFTQFQPPSLQESGVAQQGRNLDEFYSSGIYAGEYNPLGAVARSIGAGAQGIQDVTTFGFGDELLGSVVPGATIEGERARNEAIQASNPWAYGAGQVAGGLGMAARLGPVLPTSQVAANAPLAARVGAGVLEGGAMGGLYGAGSGEGTWDRVKEATFGAATGGAIGGLVPVISSAASSAYRNIADRGAKSQVARDAGVSPEVARLLANVTEADATLGPAGMANMARAGNEAMIADAGPNARQVLDYSIQRGGPGAVLARQRIDERLGRDAAAMTGMLDQTLGTPEGILASQNAIRQASRPGVNAAYQAAEAAPINYATPEGMMVEDIINRIPNRFKSQAIQRANERLAYEGTPNLQIMADIADDGSVVFREMPNVAQADAIKKALDEIARDGTDIGGKMSAEASFASRMARDLRDAVSSAVPEYGQALKTAADPLSRIAATEVGGSLLSDRVTRDQAAMMLDRMSDAEKTAARQGVRSFIDDQMARVKTAFTDPNIDAREAASAIKNLSSRANRDKLTTLLGNAEAKTLFDELDRVSQSFGLKASVAQNSKTFARQATDEMAKGMTEPGAIGTLAQGEPLNATKRVIQALTGQTPEAIRGRQDAIISDVAEFLTRPSSQAIPQFQAVQNFGGKLAANDLRAMEIARLLSQGRNAVYPATVMANE